MSALDQLHRGPDRYARMDIREWMRQADQGVTPAPWPMPLTDSERDELWRKLGTYVKGLCDRLDDAERLLEERQP